MSLCQQIIISLLAGITASAITIFIYERSYKKYIKFRRITGSYPQCYKLKNPNEAETGKEWEIEEVSDGAKAKIKHEGGNVLKINHKDSIENGEEEKKEWEGYIYMDSPYSGYCVWKYVKGLKENKIRVGHKRVIYFNDEIYLIPQKYTKYEKDYGIEILKKKR